jgi:hypothetical protein
MKRLDLIKVLYIVCILGGYEVALAGIVDSRLSNAAKEEIAAFSLLMQGIKSGEDISNSIIEFQNKMTNLGKSLQSGSRKGLSHKDLQLIRSKSTHYTDLAAVAKEVHDYHKEPTDSKKARLEGIARTYGGDVHKLVWSVINSVQ